MDVPDPSDILEAAVRLEGVVNRTPVVTSRTLNNITGGDIFLKAENFQRGGAFKFRGAYNAISQLGQRQLETGIIAHSSGNHAQGVALAARLLGADATIVMPHDAPKIKKDAAAGYGANIHFCDAEQRESETERLIAEHGYTLIHPYDNAHIIAGQGTAAYELFTEVESLDVLFVPVGGGGLISGSALAAAAVSPGCKVIGVEPSLADDAARSWRQGKLVSLSKVPATIADGLRPLRIGMRNLEIMRQYVAMMLTVDEEEIIATTKFIWQRLKLVVEPSAATALAPLLSGQFPTHDLRVGVILSGGNVDITPQQIVS